MIKKDLLVDFRQKYVVAGIALYVFATIYIAYLAFNNVITPAIWNALFWLILLFFEIFIIIYYFIGRAGRNGRAGRAGGMDGRDGRAGRTGGMEWRDGWAGRTGLRETVTLFQI